MRVLGVLGSPRRGGNSEVLARAIIAPLEESGADVTVAELNRLQYRGCQACRACKTTLEHCVLEDDLKPVLEAFRESDVIVLASPVYFGDMTGQMKCFFDRTFENLVPDYAVVDHPSRLAPGKQAVIVVTQAAPDAHFADVIPRYSAFLDWYGIETIHTLRAVDVHERGEVRTRTDYLQNAQTIAERILGSLHRQSPDG